MKTADTRVVLGVTYVAAGTPVYKVVKATNTTEFSPGDRLTKDEVDRAIYRGIKVNVS